MGGDFQVARGANAATVPSSQPEKGVVPGARGVTSLSLPALRADIKHERDETKSLYDNATKGSLGKGRESYLPRAYADEDTYGQALNRTIHGTNGEPSARELTEQRLGQLSRELRDVPPTERELKKYHEQEKKDFMQRHRGQISQHRDEWNEMISRQKDEMKDLPSERERKSIIQHNERIMKEMKSTFEAQEKLEKKVVDDYSFAKKARQSIERDGFDEARGGIALFGRNDAQKAANVKYENMRNEIKQTDREKGEYENNIRARHDDFKNRMKDLDKRYGG